MIRPPAGSLTTANVSRLSVFKRSHASLLLERALRHVDYNVQELISLACDSVGATGCTEMIKIAEG